jgi:hypothetical protein
MRIGGAGTRSNTLAPDTALDGAVRRKGDRE